MFDVSPGTRLVPSPHEKHKETHQEFFHLMSIPKLTRSNLRAMASYLKHGEKRRTKQKRRRAFEIELLRFGMLEDEGKYASSDGLQRFDLGILIAMASDLIAMASNLRAMTSS